MRLSPDLVLLGSLSSIGVDMITHGGTVDMSSDTDEVSFRVFSRIMRNELIILPNEVKHGA